MATTEAHLQTKETGELAMSLVFDGYNLVCTTTADTAGIVTAYAGTAWTTVKANLEIVGTTRQEITPFQSNIQPSALEFRILDDGTLRQLLLGNPSSTDSTFLTSTVLPDDTTLNVKDTTDFASSGTVYLGMEAIAYSSKTAATLVTSARGKWALFGIDGGTEFARAHRVQPGTANTPASAPEVRSVPNVWYNRMVALVLHHAEGTGVTGAKTWSTATLPLSDANAQCLWSGRIKSWSDDGTGWISIQCISVHELLSGSLWNNQFIGEFEDGQVVTDAEAAFGFYMKASSGLGFHATTTLSAADPFVTDELRYDELVAYIQSRFTSLQPDGTLYSSLAAQKWQIEIRDGEFGPRVVIEAEVPSPPTNPQFAVLLHPKIYKALGFPNERHRAHPDVNGRLVGVLELHRVSSTLFRVQASGPPRLYDDESAIRPNKTFRVQRLEGEWLAQPDESIPAVAAVDADGFLQLGDRLIAANYTESTRTFTAKYLDLDVDPEDGADSSRGTGIAGVTARPQARQIWVERDSAGKLLLRLMLSSGSPAYNHADYDVYGEGFGLGIPAGLIDVESFLALDVQYELHLEGPTPFRELLEQVLAVFNRHLIFEDGQLKLTPPGFDAPNAEDVIDIDEDSKADPMERTSVVYATDGIINRLRLKYTSLDISTRINLKPFGPEVFVSVKRLEPTVIVADVSSESTYGQQRTLDITARGILDPSAWTTGVAVPAIKYFAHPFATVRRSISPRMFHVTPGDICKLTDNYLVDPTTGERGASGLAGWVRAVEIDWRSMRGFIEFVYLPTHPASRYAKWSPALAVDSTYNTGDYDAGYDSVSYRLKTTAHAFSRGTDGADTSFLSATDTIQVKERSPSTPASPTTYTGTVSSILSTTEIQLTGALSGGAWDITKKYVIEPRDYANQTTTQKAFAQIADDTDQKIVDAAPAKLWAGTHKGLTGFDTSIPYTTEFIRPSDNDDAEGQPLSTRKLYDVVTNCNNLAAYTTRNVLVSDASFFASRSTSETSYVLVWGPVWCPLYGVSLRDFSRRQLLGKVRIRSSNASGTCTARLVSSAQLPKGSSFIAPSYGWASLTHVQTATRASTTYAWEDLAAFTPIATTYEGQVGCWLSLEIKISNGAYVAYASGLSVVEAALS